MTSHSRMSGSRWVITLSWLSGSWRSYEDLFGIVLLCKNCHLFLISSASVRSIPCLSFVEPIFAWNVPLLSLIFLKRSLVFPILLFSSIYLRWSLRKAFLPKSATPRATVPATLHCWPVPPGDTQTQFCLSLCGVSGTLWTQGLFEPSERLWLE